MAVGQNQPGLFAWSEVLKFAIPLLLALLAIITFTLVANQRLARQYAKTKAAENQVAYQLALKSSLLDSVACMAVAPGVVATLLRQSAAQVIEPTVVWLSEKE